MQSPPTREDSTRHAVLPNVDANFAAVNPADPPPITIRSYVADIDDGVDGDDDVGASFDDGGTMEDGNRVLFHRVVMASRDDDDDGLVGGANASSRCNGRE